MNAFQRTLDLILEQAKARFTGAAFAKAAGIGASDLSRLRKGTTRPTRAYIQSILSCPLLDHQEARQILLSYLRDEVPDHLTGDIIINLADPATITEPKAGDPVEAALITLRRRSAEDPAFADWLCEFTRLLNGGQPSS